MPSPISPESFSVSTAGPTIIQIIEGVLDEAVRDVRRARGPVERQLEQRYALGLATALAYLYNPYNPDVDAQRQAAKARSAVVKNRKVR